MRALREKDYEEMAGRVVDQFMQNGTKLADGAVEEAVGGQLNPDQVERLVQAANTMAFLRLMEARKAEGAPDLTHEFEPVDTRSILQAIIGRGPDLGGPETPLLSPGPDGDDAPLPDEMRGLREGPSSGKDSPIKDDDGPFPKGERQKAQDAANPRGKEPAHPAGKDLKKEAMIRNRQLAKLASVFDDQLIEAEMSFDDAYGRFSEWFKLAHGAPRFEAFEKDAMSLVDDDHGLAVLNLMRQGRGLPCAGRDVLEKCASLCDRHVTSDYPALREFRRMVEIAKQASRVRDGASHVRSLCV